MEKEDVIIIGGVVCSTLIVCTGLGYMLLYPGIPIPDTLKSLLNVAVGFLFGAGLSNMAFVKKIFK